VNFHTLRVLAAARRYIESTQQQEDGSYWGQIHIPNLKLENLTAHQIAGHLSVLKKYGKYEPISEDFGLIKLPD
jgi:hypothetical protein